MAHHKLSEEIINSIHVLRLEGKTHAEIGIILNVSHSIVSRYLDPRQKVKMREEHRQNHISTRINGERVRLIAKKRPMPDNCELCHKKETLEHEKARLVWHHWNDEHPELGMWICLQCHSFAGRVDDGWVEVYLKLKESLNVINKV
jgi:predicted transcriptional regulator